MTDSEITWQQEFIAHSIYRIDESQRMIHQSMEILDEDDMWKRANNSSNSIGNLILHLCGNLTQYGISSLSSVPDMRKRDEEFNSMGGVTKSDLLEKLDAVIVLVKENIAACSIEQLLKIRTVQSFTMSGIGVIIHLVEHLSYHTGQIAFWTKILKDQDLGFYEGFDLNSKNS